METCCESLIKYFMIICNCVFALIGALLIGFGAYAQIEAKDYLNFLGDNYVNTPIFIIILGKIIIIIDCLLFYDYVSSSGAVIFVISFFGCCGACNENKCMMYFYGFLLFCVLIAQIGSGIAAFALKGDLQDEIKKNMEEGLKYYDTPNNEPFTTTWDLVQKNVECCGVENYKDWETRYNSSTTVPDSCCISGQVEGCGVDYKKDQIFQDGCFTKFSDTFKDNLNIVGGKLLHIHQIQVSFPLSFLVI